MATQSSPLPNKNVGINMQIYETSLENIRTRIKAQES